MVSNMHGKTVCIWWHEWLNQGSMAFVMCEKLFDWHIGDCEWTNLGREGTGGTWGSKIICIGGGGPISLWCKTVWGWCVGEEKSLFFQWEAGTCDQGHRPSPPNLLTHKLVCYVWVAYIFKPGNSCNDNNISNKPMHFSEVGPDVLKLV